MNADDRGSAPLRPSQQSQPQEEPTEEEAQPGDTLPVAGLLPVPIPAPPPGQGQAQGVEGGLDAEASKPLLAQRGRADAMQPVDGLSQADALQAGAGQLVQETRPGDVRALSSLDARMPVAMEPAGQAAAVPVATTLSSPASTTMQATQATTPDQTLRAAVGTPRWADELGSRLVLLSSRGQHEGSLSLSPEHLGPLEVRISMNQHTASVWFGAQHADTRAALAEALPRLRELFCEAGLSLGHAGISQEAPRQDARGSFASGTTGNGEAGNPHADAAPAVATHHVASGVLDLYA